MKKLMFLIPIISLSSCARFFNNTLPCLNIRVNAKYSDDGYVYKVLSDDIDIGGIKMYDYNTKKRVRDMNFGDDLLVYYKDSTYRKIDHVFIDRAKKIELSARFEPGSGDIDFYPSAAEHIVCNHSDIEFVIYNNSDHSMTYTVANEIDEKLTYWGIYRDEDSVDHDSFTTIKLIAVYANL